MVVDPKDLTVLSGEVVIVEDDDLMQGILVEVFTDLGGTCVAFDTADDALMHLLQTRRPPEMLITDFTLPGQLDGRELALMVNQRWPELPILLISGYGAEIAGGLPKQIAFLQKPWSVEQLSNLVRTAIKTAM